MCYFMISIITYVPVLIFYYLFRYVGSLLEIYIHFSKFSCVCVMLLHIKVMVATVIS